MPCFSGKIPQQTGGDGRLKSTCRTLWNGKFQADCRTSPRKGALLFAARPFVSILSAYIRGRDRCDSLNRHTRETSLQLRRFSASRPTRLLASINQRKSSCSFRIIPFNQGETISGVHFFRFTMNISAKVIMKCIVGCFQTPYRLLPCP